MANSSIPVTRLSLIARLSDHTDTAAWEEFAARYGRVLDWWCRRWGLQEADAEDVTQNILLELARHVHSYRPTGKFRVWLRTVARRAWFDYSIKRARKDRGSGDDEIALFLDSVEARDELLARIESEAQAELLDLAKSRVREQVSENVWRSFTMLTIDGSTGEEVSRALGIQPGSAYVANCRVKKLLQQELDQLNGENDDEQPAPE